MIYTVLSSGHFISFGHLLVWFVQLYLLPKYQNVKPCFALEGVFLPAFSWLVQALRFVFWQIRFLCLVPRKKEFRQLQNEKDFLYRSNCLSSSILNKMGQAFKCRRKMNTDWIEFFENWTWIWSFLYRRRENVDIPDLLRLTFSSLTDKRSISSRFNFSFLRTSNSRSFSNKFWCETLNWKKRKLVSDDLKVTSNFIIESFTLSISPENKDEI